MTKCNKINHLCLFYVGHSVLETLGEMLIYMYLTFVVDKTVHICKDSGRRFIENNLCGSYLNGRVSYKITNILPHNQACLITFEKY